LLVEDDERLAALVREYLVGHGFAVSVEGRGDTAPSRILLEQPDLVILDLMLPGQDGLEVCRQVRAQYRGGILMLTARGDEVDEVVGLELGADDYLPKPVRPRLLLARVNTLLRRLRSSAAAPSSALASEARPFDEAPQRVTVGPLTIDAAARGVWMAGAAVQLTTAEFDLLWLLATRAGEVLSREDIYQALRGIEYDGLDRSIDLRVARLRKKLGEDATEPMLVKSIRGVGYLLARPA
jgi:two-component system response regulator RstA